jgi:hypothetical protein
MGPIMAASSKRPGLQDLKKKKDSPPRRSLQEILQWGVGSLNTPSRGTDATGEPTIEISVKGRDELVVRNLPKVISRTLLSE